MFYKYLFSFVLRFSVVFLFLIFVSGFAYGVRVGLFCCCCCCMFGLYFSFFVLFLVRWLVVFLGRLLGLGWWSSRSGRSFREIGGYLREIG